MTQAQASRSTKPGRSLSTARGDISFPAYLPVTTFGKKYPLDDLIRPYLPRLASAVMVSHYYAQQMEPEQRPSLPMWVDSGGFAALFEGSKILKKGDVGLLELTHGDIVETLHPKDVLAFQETHADVALTLDFPIPPGLSSEGKSAASAANHRQCALGLGQPSPPKPTALRLYPSLGCRLCPILR